MCRIHTAHLHAVPELLCRWYVRESMCVQQLMDPKHVLCDYRLPCNGGHSADNFAVGSAITLRHLEHDLCELGDASAKRYMAAFFAKLLKDVWRSLGVSEYGCGLYRTEVMPSRQLHLVAALEYMDQRGRDSIGTPKMNHDDLHGYTGIAPQWYVDVVDAAWVEFVAEAA